MVFHAASILNRIKHIKGWKNAPFPIKLTNYSRDLSLWLKIYLLLKAYFSLYQFNLLSCYLLTIENNVKVLSLIITPKIDRYKKKHYTPLLYPKSKKAIYLLYKHFFQFRNILLWTKNFNNKKEPNSKWLIKPRISNWLNFFKVNNKWRQYYKWTYPRLFFKNKTKLYRTSVYKFIFTSKKKTLQTLESLVIKKINQKWKKYLTEYLLLEKKLFLLQALKKKNGKKYNQKIFAIYKELRTKLLNTYIHLVRIQHQYKGIVKYLKTKKLTKTSKQKIISAPNTKILINNGERKRIWKLLTQRFIKLTALYFASRYETTIKHWKKLNKYNIIHSSQYVQTHNYKIKVPRTLTYLKILKHIYYYLIQWEKLWTVNRNKKKNTNLYQKYLFFFLISKYVTKNLDRHKIIIFKKNFLKRINNRTYIKNKKRKKLKLRRVNNKQNPRNKSNLLFAKTLLHTHTKLTHLSKYKKKTIRNLPQTLTLFKILRAKKHTKIQQYTQKKILDANISWKKQLQNVLISSKFKLQSKKYIINKFNPNKSQCLTKNKKYNPIKWWKRLSKKKFVYRLSYKKNFEGYIKFKTKYALKYHIQQFIQAYFQISLNVKILNLASIFNNKRYYQITFPQPNLDKERKKKKEKNITIKKQKKGWKKEIKNRKYYLFVATNARRFLRPNQKKLPTRQNKLYANLIKLKKKYLHHKIRYYIIKNQQNDIFKKKRLRLITKKIYILKQKIYKNKKYLEKIHKNYLKQNFNTKKMLKKKKELQKLITTMQKIHLLKEHNYDLTIPVLLLFLKYLDPQILANYLVKTLKMTKNHWPILHEIHTMLQNFRLRHPVIYKISIFGRINSSKKTRLVCFTNGTMSRQRFSNRINFASAQTQALIGTIGVKIWVYQ